MTGRRFKGAAPKKAPNKALHNLFFEISTGCGLPAALLYVAHFAIVWLMCFRLYWSRRTLRPRGHPLEAAMLAVIAGQIGYWGGSMFSSGALIESSYVCLAIGAATLCVHARLFSAPRVTDPVEVREPTYGPVRASSY